MQDRVRSVLKIDFGDSQAEMARATGLSLAGIAKVVTGRQEAGRRFMEALLKATDANPAWLLTGIGPPRRSTSLRVAMRPLLDPTRECKGLPASGPDVGIDALWSPTRYWLQVQASDPIVRDRGAKVATGDFILMETDRTRFPAAERFHNRLCIIRVSGRDGLSARLASVEHFPATTEEPERVEADTFDLGPDIVEQLVIENPYGPNPRVIPRRFERLKTGPQRRPGRRLDRPIASEPLPRQVKWIDVIAVSMFLFRA